MSFETYRANQIAMTAPAQVDCGCACICGNNLTCPMLKDAIWESIRPWNYEILRLTNRLPDPDAVLGLCWPCAEQRLGREITQADLMNEVEMLEHIMEENRKLL